MYASTHFLFTSRDDVMLHSLKESHEYGYDHQINISHKPITHILGYSICSLKGLLLLELNSKPRKANTQNNRIYL